MLPPREELELKVARLSVKSRVLEENAGKHKEQIRAMVEARRLCKCFWSR